MEITLRQAQGYSQVIQWLNRIIQEFCCDTCDEATEVLTIRVEHEDGTVREQSFRCVPAPELAFALGRTIGLARLFE